MDARRIVAFAAVLYSLGGLLLDRATAQDAAAAFAPDAAVAAVSGCSGTKTSTYPCREWICVGDTWELVNKAPGSACNDKNACTYNDVCDSSLQCRGTLGCIPSGPCEVCNGTTSCAKAAAGTACPSSPDGNPCEAVCDGSSLYCQPL